LNHSGTENSEIGEGFLDVLLHSSVPFVVVSALIVTEFAYQEERL
jgi:hypothetical protein